jgi:hypothetical protein
MVGAPMGSAFRNVDNKLLHCRQGDVEGIGMRDQYIRGSFPQDLKGCDEADYCGINGGPEHCFARLKENEGGVLLFAGKESRTQVAEAAVAVCGRVLQEKH